MSEQHLPAWGSVAVVIAHPDDESFGLGAVIDAFVRAGARVQVACLSQGEASTLGSSAADLAATRAAELQEAARRLGVAQAHLLGFPDGGLSEVPVDRLLPAVEAVIEPADGLLAFDINGLTGHPDHVRATEVAEALAERWGCGLLGWTVTREIASVLQAETGATFVGHDRSEVDITVTVDRRVQRSAIEAHRTQAVPGSPVWRRLELSGDVERLRWIVRPV